MAFDFPAVGSPLRMQPGLLRLAPGEALHSPSDSAWMARRLHDALETMSEAVRTRRRPGTARERRRHGLARRAAAP